METNRPELLAKWEDQRKQFVMVGDTITVLRKIQQEVVVIGIVGNYRKGKSYIMNKIAQLSDGDGMVLLYMRYIMFDNCE